MKFAKRRRVTQVTCIVLALFLTLGVLATLIGALASGSSGGSPSSDLPRLLFHDDSLYIIQGEPLSSLPEEAASTFTAQRGEEDKIPSEEDTVNFAAESLSFAVLPDGTLYYHGEEGFVLCTAVTVEEGGD